MTVAQDFDPRTTKRTLYRNEHTADERSSKRRKIGSTNDLDNSEPNAPPSHCDDILEHNTPTDDGRTTSIPNDSSAGTSQVADSLPSPSIAPQLSNSSESARDWYCVGTICAVDVQLRRMPVPDRFTRKAAAQNNIEYTRFSIAQHVDRLTVHDVRNEPFGVLGSTMTMVLKRLLRLITVDIDIVAATRDLEKAGHSWKNLNTSAKFPAEINVYGHEEVINEIGKQLTEADVHLQPPAYDFRKLEYMNPQYLILPGLADLEERLPQLALSTEQAQADEVSDAAPPNLESLMDQMAAPTYLRQRDSYYGIRTVLKSYQKEGHDFVQRRETGEMPPSHKLWQPKFSGYGTLYYQNVITKSKSKEASDMFGGLLADDMGLGKSLTMITAILSTKQSAVKYTSQALMRSTQTAHEPAPSKATLILVPSALLIDNWMDEIVTHTHTSLLSVHRYHGPHKKLDLMGVLQQDIILTTYATLLDEFRRGHGLLYKVRFYRVVLDEAHQVRNWSTKQFRAVQEVATHIRWCMTGTPIQNSLEDLGALVKFLRVPILEELPAFRRHLANPIASGGGDGFANLRRLLESICLRRTKEVLGLPEPATATLTCRLSTRENATYTDLLQLWRVVIDRNVSGRNSKRVNQNILQAIQRLRIFCNNGIRSIDNRDFLAGLSSTFEDLAGEDIHCSSCGNELASSREANESIGSVIIPCHHHLCSECHTSHIAHRESAEDGRIECPSCNQFGRAERLECEATSGDSLTVQCATEPPAKLLRVLSCLDQQITGDKSIVFSSWKKTLDILALLLEDAKLPFVRIDGSMTLKNRRDVLDTFEKNPACGVLLITLGTGAVGLNKLSAANRIHILEPQWNPSVENQAIGRLLRLGQSRDITIIRYIVEGTLEEAVQSQQLRKLQLSRGGFGQGKEVQAKKRIDEIMALLRPSMTAMEKANSERAERST